MIESLEELLAHALKKKESEKNSHEELRVCIGSSCASLGADELKKGLKTKVKDENLDKQCSVKGVGCNGLCSAAIMVSHYDKEKELETIYGGVEQNDIDDLVGIIKDKSSLENKKCDMNEPFFTKQKKIVLENAGVIDPDDIDDYIAHGGYIALFTALEEMRPEDIINEVKVSGLRGRGGGGYPTGLKWETVAKVESNQKYIVCNGDEGDPGAFMDRAVMEADPHKIIEGMALCAYACGADKGYIYVRAEYPEAVKKLNKAIKQARNNGILGNQIANSGFNFDLEVRLGGGAFVCGEATALVTSIEGNRGQPRQKPPHLSNSGLWGEPTILNNVETFANIAPIIKNGGEWYSSMGTKNSTGTKVFALTGNIKNTGLVEVPMGITLRELIYDIGGGVTDDKPLKAIQTGGPSGGCIPEELLDIKVDYDSLKEVGSIMGSGGLIVMDENSNMLEVARFFMEFSKDESCGKCVPCRVGTTELTNLLDKFVKKEASKSDFQLLKDMCEVVKESSLCGLGQAAPNPVLSTIKYFENEYLEGIKDD
ncbi:NuoF family protein [Candidatus Sulfurimonas baltica]|uniref:SLBB domain-containing protein n=1 Tax=Candidatus Sulfurimonas baltica TaxID=2740404 RepID=A0A7S7LWY1_9BACT|nr:NuoF family protein [Candidatus Sulfurimonas baltica]QOY52910.1 SLBB domain-containing protein [Candidatus Sulfurimonas baltica]